MRPPCFGSLRWGRERHPISDGLGPDGSGIRPGANFSGQGLGFSRFPARRGWAHVLKRRQSDFASPDKAGAYSAPCRWISSWLGRKASRIQPGSTAVVRNKLAVGPWSRRRSWRAPAWPKPP